MEKEQIKLELIEVIAEALDVDPKRIKEDTSLQEDLGVDSLDAINILLAIEEKFNIEVDDATARNFRSVPEIMESLMEKFELVEQKV